MGNMSKKSNHVHIKMSNPNHQYIAKNYMFIYTHMVKHRCNSCVQNYRTGAEF